MLDWHRPTSRHHDEVQLPSGSGSKRQMRAASGLVMLTLLTTGILACKSSPGPTTSAEPATAESPRPSVGGGPQTTTAAGFDQRFIDMMVPHHEAGIAMAKLAQERASHPELKKKASEMIQKQEQEIRELKTWRRGWFGSDETPSMNMMPMLAEMGQARTENMSDHVNMLKQAPDFDRAFLEHMIPHHRQAIEAAKLAQNRAEHPDLKEKAAKMVSEQEYELRELENWKAQWFGTR